MNTKEYEISGQSSLNLSNFTTKTDKKADKTEIVEKLLPKNISEMSGIQETLYAENRHALLIVLQAMDAAGKDGIISHVMSGINPQGTHVASFKAPSTEENDHDYLWRISKELPRRGEIGIFNRSHYEEVLVARVHDLVLNSQIPKDLVTGEIWEQRYRQIRNFEEYLTENGTVIVKIFLHISKDEQRQRLLDRIAQPDKNWKFSAGDIEERKYWDQYMKAYEQMLEQTATERAPWYVVPADSKWFARYLVSQIVLETLQKINPKVPELTGPELATLEECRRILEKDE